MVIDVRLVQKLLNQYKLIGFPTGLTVDGKSGRNTIKRIRAFQTEIVKIVRPDGRIDPNGKSFKALNKAASVTSNGLIDKSALMPLATCMNNATTLGLLNAITSVAVTYKADLAQEKRIVSEYSKTLIKIALIKAGMSHAVITSTKRNADHQAQLMYRNAKINFDKQYRLYGKNGKDVLAIYKANKVKDAGVVIKLMEDRINELLAAGKKVSKHVVTDAQYKSLNVIDIGLNSTRAKNGVKTFNQQGFTAALKELKSKGYIKKFIDETHKSNQCWHIEVKPNAKTIT